MSTDMLTCRSLVSTAPRHGSRPYLAITIITGDHIYICGIIHVIAINNLLCVFSVKITKILLDVAKIVRCRAKVDLAHLVREVLDENLPQDAHVKLSGRLHISVTLVAGLDTGLVTQFRSREHLIEVST